MWPAPEVRCPGSRLSRGARVIGVNFSPAMLSEARQRHRSLEFAKAMPRRCLRGRDVRCRRHGLRPPQLSYRAALAEARRVLRAGAAALTTWASPREHVLHGIITDAVRTAGDPSASLPTAPGGAVNETQLCLRLLEEEALQRDSCAPRSSKRGPRPERRGTGRDDRGRNGRMAATLRAQPADKRAAILAAIERGIAPYRDATATRSLRRHPRLRWWPGQRSR